MHCMYLTTAQTAMNSLSKLLRIKHYILWWDMNLKLLVLELKTTKVWSHNSQKFLLPYCACCEQVNLTRIVFHIRDNYFHSVKLTFSDIFDKKLRPAFIDRAWRRLQNLRREQGLKRDNWKKSLSINVGDFISKCKQVNRALYAFRLSSGTFLLDVVVVDFQRNQSHFSCAEVGHQLAIRPESFQLPQL